MPALEPMSQRGSGSAALSQSATDSSSSGPAEISAGLRGAARGGTLNIAGAICNQACLFVIAAVVARALGKSVFGEYALGLAALSLAGVLALFGFQMGLTRFVTIHLADADNGRLLGTIRMGIGFSVSLSVSIAVILAVLAEPLATVFHHPEFGSDLRLVALALPAGTIRDACLAATQGWRTQRPFALVTWVYEPALRLALTGAALALGYGLTGAFLAIVIGSWTAAFLAIRFLIIRLREIPHATPIFDVRPVFGFSLVSFGTGLASLGLIWADLIILGMLSTTADAGVYNISTRLINLAIFIMLPINAAFAPQFAHLLHRGDFRQLRQLYTMATTWILRLSLPAFALLVVFPGNLLRIFGPQYVVGASVTIILTFGQLVNAATGPCGTLLNMGGRIRLNMVNNIAVLILNVGLNIFLIPRYGVVGAALSWSASLVLVNVTRVIQLHVILHAMPFGIGTVKSLAAAGLATIAGYLVRASVHGETAQLLVGSVGIALVYICTVIFLKIDAEDRQLASNLLRQS